MVSTKVKKMAKIKIKGEAPIVVRRNLKQKENLVTIIQVGNNLTPLMWLTQACQTSLEIIQALENHKMMSPRVIILRVVKQRTLKPKITLAKEPKMMTLAKNQNLAKKTKERGFSEVVKKQVYKDLLFFAC